MKPRQVIILAAGLGSRLQHLTQALPKALIPFCGKPLLGYALDFARQAVGPEGQRIVVSGFCADQVQEYVNRYAPDASVVFNPDFRKGNLLSVKTGVDSIQKGFLLMNVDHVYPFAFADRLMSAPGQVVLAVDRDRPLGSDDMKVEYDSAGAVNRMSKKLEAWNCGYIGMTRVDDEAGADYRAAMLSVIARHPETAVAEDVIAELHERKTFATTCDLSGLGWIEIDNCEELAAGEQRLAQDPDLLRRGWETSRVADFV